MSRTPDQNDPIESSFPKLATRALFWLVYWASCFCLWLLFVNTTKLHELWMAAMASILGATAAEVVREQPFAEFRPRLSWLLQAWQEPWYILQGCTVVLWAFLKHLVKPEQSVLREVVFDSGGSDAQSAARRALAITYTTMPPNFVVISIDLKKKAMLVHQVSESATPSLTRTLGAKS